MSHRDFPAWILIVLLAFTALGLAALPRRPAAEVPLDTTVRILQAEDTRQWDSSIEKLFGDADIQVRLRAMLAAGRIGDVAAVPALSRMLAESPTEPVGVMAAFALGEIEAPSAAAVLAAVLRDSLSAAVRAACVEALGKIAAALPESDTDGRETIGGAIVATLNTQARRPHPDRDVVLRALTATLRARPDGGPAAVATYLTSSDSRLRGDALNTLARLRAQESLNLIREMLVQDLDPFVRANAARTLGAAVDVAAVDALTLRIAADPDSRSRVAAIRALAAIADGRAASALLKRGAVLLRMKPQPKNELLEIATALGRVLPNTNDAEAAEFLSSLRNNGVIGTEVETAYARIAPELYLTDPAVRNPPADQWQQVSAIAAAFAEIASLKDGTPVNAATLKTSALANVRSLLNDSQTSPYAVPDLLLALQSFRPDDLAEVLRAKLGSADFVVRATAADVLGELQSSPETTRALINALTASSVEESDVALSIVGALAKSSESDATAALQRAGTSPDHLVRRRAIDALKVRPGSVAPTVGPVVTRNTRTDYIRAAERVGRLPRAVVTTSKGVITIELNPAEAPMTVDSFIRLAQKNYFDQSTFHRVVPNFVIQGGDPRGDGNGGPGYAIRCEINALAYDKGTVGMALSGKDTGGSQFFVTHSPQPHLDGGYTVFGRVVSGQNVVDAIERGDRIHSVRIEE